MQKEGITLDETNLLYIVGRRQAVTGGYGRKQQHNAYGPAAD